MMERMRHDVWIGRIIVCFLGSCALITVLGVIALDYAGKEIPPSLTALSGTCIGSISSLLFMIFRFNGAQSTK